MSVEKAKRPVSMRQKIKSITIVLFASSLLAKGILFSDKDDDASHPAAQNLEADGGSTPRGFSLRRSQPAIYADSVKYRQWEFKLAGCETERLRSVRMYFGEGLTGRNAPPR
ncbi:MAG: hypothetical protein L6R39_006783, partial [Caloplaca ligustica]